jgi:hypothetical protein
LQLLLALRFRQRGVKARIMALMYSSAFAFAAFALAPESAAR